jgi:hypothetical protein
MNTRNFQARNKAQSDMPKSIGRSSNPSLFVLSGLAILLLTAVFLLIYTSEDEIDANNVQDPPHNFTQNPAPPTSQPTTAREREAYRQLPLSFEANHGQADASVNFVARGAGYALSPMGMAQNCSSSDQCEQLRARKYV